MATSRTGGHIFVPLHLQVDLPSSSVCSRGMGESSRTHRNERGPFIDVAELVSLQCLLCLETCKETPGGSREGPWGGVAAQPAVWLHLQAEKVLVRRPRRQGERTATSKLRVKPARPEALLQLTLSIWRVNILPGNSTRDSFFAMSHTEAVAQPWPENGIL